MAFPASNLNNQESAKVPAPPPAVVEQGGHMMAEVTVRTLASDLISLGITGGAGAIGENFTVSLNDPEAPPPKRIDFRQWGMWALVVLSGLTFLFLLGYYFIPAVMQALR